MTGQTPTSADRFELAQLLGRWGILDKQTGKRSGKSYQSRHYARVWLDDLVAQYPERPNIIAFIIGTTAAS